MRITPLTATAAWAASIAIVTSCIGAPASAAEPDSADATSPSIVAAPTPHVGSDANAEDSRMSQPTRDAKDTTNSARASDGNCSLDGAKSKADRDCLVLRVKGDEGRRVGDTVVLTGRLRGDVKDRAVRQDGKVKVAISRATDGGTWSDDGNRWTKVKKVSIDRRGQFVASIPLDNAGLHTYRATVLLGNLAHVRSTPRARTLARSDIAEATAGAPGVVWEFRNASSHDLDLELVGLTQADSTSLGKNSFAQGERIAAVVAGAPSSVATGFVLHQTEKNSVIGDPSTYTFRAYSNEDNACADVGLDRLAKVKHGETIQVTFEDAGFFGLGYNGTLRWPSGDWCTFRMLTTTQDYLADQPTWLKVVEVVAGVIVACVVIYYGAAELGAIGSGAAEAIAVNAYTASITSADSVASSVAADETALGWLRQLQMERNAAGAWQIERGSVERAISSASEDGWHVAAEEFRAAAPWLQ